MSNKREGEGGGKGRVKMLCVCQRDSQDSRLKERENFVGHAYNFLLRVFLV